MKIRHLILACILAFGIGRGGAIVFADGAGVDISPDRTSLTGYGEFDQAHAAMHLHTSVGPFYNLSTTSYQKIVGFSTSKASANMTVDTGNGDITLGAGADGTYIAAWHTTFKATEGALIHWDLRKNGTSIHTTSREMTTGPIRKVAFVNLSAIAGDATIDLHQPLAASSGWTTYTNVTSTTRRLKALRAFDRSLLHINESATAPGIVFTTRYDGVDSPKSVMIDDFAYDGNIPTHYLKMQALNTTLGTYTAMTDNGSDIRHGGVSLPATPDVYSQKEFLFPTPNRDYVNAQGQSFVRLLHAPTVANSNHDLEIDRMQVRDALNSLVIEITVSVSLVEGDVITLHVKADSPETEYYSFGQGVELSRIGR